MISTISAKRKQDKFTQFSLFVIRLFMITIITLTLQFSLSSCRNSIFPNSIKSENLILVCGGSKVLLVNYTNYNDSIPQIIWSWDAHIANDLPSPFKTKKFNSIDDCKAVNNGNQIMVSASSGAVAIINIKDKKVIFYTDVPNAHSIEILPNNKIVAAASTARKGNRLMIFDISNPEKLLFSDSLYSAHGIVWDAHRNSLFALGYDVLREYKIENEISLVLHDEWKIPGIGGHDLQMASDRKKLFITEHTGAWVFNLENLQFSKINKFQDEENIKSINQNKSGQFVYTVPEESWWTYHVLFHNPSGVLSFPDMHVYKARWFNNNSSLITIER